MKKILSSLLLASSFQFLVSGYVQAQSITPITDSSGTTDSTKLSGNGAVVTGYLYGNTYRWENGVFTLLPTLTGGSYTVPGGISQDGSTIVGYAERSDGNLEAVLWRNGSVTGLGFLGGAFSESQAYGANADGSVIVGFSRNLSGNREAFRWENGSMTALGFLSGGTASQANDITPDSSIIVGFSNGLGGGYRAVRWNNGVIEALDRLAGYNNSFASAVSANGQVAVGYSENTSGYRNATRWDGTTMTVLAPGNVTSYAYDVSANGSIVVGFSDAGGSTAVLWDANNNLIELGQRLTDQGTDISGWNFIYADGISDDGTIVAGLGSLNGVQQAYIANLVTAGLTTPDGLAQSLNTVAEASQMAVGQMSFYTQQGIFAAQNLDAISAPIREGGFALRIPADVEPAAGGGFETAFSAFMLGGYGMGANNESDNDQWNGTIGVSAEIAKDIHLGVGALAGQSYQELDFDGEADLDALGGTAIASYQPGDTGFRAYASAYAAHLSLDIERGYLNGAALDSSSGDTEGVSYGGAIKFGWQEELTDRVRVMPFVEGRYSKTKIDGYQEEGGAFAARFSEQDNDYAASRLGVEFDFDVNDKFNLMLRPAWGHRLSDDNGGFTADVSGLTQSVGADAGDRNWAEASFGVKYQASDRTRFTAELTGRSGDTAEPAASLILGSTIRF